MEEENEHLPEYFLKKMKGKEEKKIEEMQTEAGDLHQQNLELLNDLKEKIDQLNKMIKNKEDEGTN